MLVSWDYYIDVSRLLFEIKETKSIELIRAIERRF